MKREEREDWHAIFLLLLLLLTNAAKNNFRVTSPLMLTRIFLFRYVVIYILWFLSSFQKRCHKLFFLNCSCFYFYFKRWVCHSAIKYILYVSLIVMRKWIRNISGIKTLQTYLAKNINIKVALYHRKIEASSLFHSLLYLHYSTCTVYSELNGGRTF